MNAVASGGRVIPKGVLDGFRDMVIEGLERGHRYQVAAGWVKHYRPQTAWQVIMQGMEFARSEDPDTPEGFYSAERFGRREERS